MTSVTNALTPPTDGKSHIATLPATSGLQRPGSEGATRLAHKLAEHIIEVWTCLVDPVEQMVARDHAALCTTMDAVTKSSEELRRASAGLSQLRELADSARKEQAELVSRISFGEGRLAEVAENNLTVHAEVGKLSEAQEELSQELSRQAGGALKIEEGLSGVEQNVRGLIERHESLEHRLVTLASEAEEFTSHLRAQEGALQAMGLSSSALSATCSKLQERQEALEKRIEAQANAMRALHSSLLPLGDWIEKLRTTLGRVEEIFRASTLGALPPDM